MAAINPGSTPPQKPWEQAGNSSGPAPFKPPSSGSTSEVVEASGTAKPGEIVSSANNGPPSTNTLGRHVPPRPWEQNSGYGSMNSGFNSGIYNSYGGFGGQYGGGLYGNSMYSGYGGPYGGTGLYGGTMYNSGFRGPMGPYGMGINSPYGNQDPNNPSDPPSPPGFWISFIRVMQGVVNFFGRISFLVDQNTQAFHLFMTALLQLFDRSGLLYGELARFVFRVLGIRMKPRQKLGPGELSGAAGVNGQKNVEGPKDAKVSWESVWGDGAKGSS